MAEIINIPVNSIIYDIDIDISSITNLPKIYSQQYDNNSRYIRAKIWNNGAEYPIGIGATIEFACTKPSTKGVDKAAGIDTNGNIVFLLDQNITAVDGTFGAEFRITDLTNGRRATPKFYIHVDKSALNNDTVTDSEDFDVLGKLIIDANTAISGANNAANNANLEASNLEQLKNNVETATQTALNAAGDVTASNNYAKQSESWAIGNVFSGDTTKNSKYYSEQAANFAAIAEQYSSIVYPNIYIDLSTGELISVGGNNIVFTIDENGYLNSEVIV